MKRKLNQLAAGSLITMSLNGSAIAVGEIIMPGISFFLCFYGRLIEKAAEVSLVNWDQEEILLIGQTTDAELQRGNWRSSGNKAPRTIYPRPYHVVNTAEGMILRTFAREAVRAASEADLELYGYEVSVSPTVFSNALRSYATDRLASDFGRIDYKAVEKRATLL